MDQLGKRFSNHSPTIFTSIFHFQTGTVSLEPYVMSDLVFISDDALRVFLG